MRPIKSSKTSQRQAHMTIDVNSYGNEIDLSLILEQIASMIDKKTFCGRTIFKLTYDGKLTEIPLEKHTIKDKPNGTKL